MAILPIRLLKIQQSVVQTMATWDEVENNDIFTGFPYKWQVSLTVEPLSHGSPSTPSPYIYDGMDIKVGDWVATSDQGFAVRIYEIVSATSTLVVANVEDVDRFNIMTDPNFSGVGIGPDGSGYVFQVDSENNPILGPGSAFYMGVTFQTDLIARFNYRNYLKEYIPVEQTGHTFIVGDAIYLDVDGTYKLFAANAANKNNLGKIIGFVSNVGVPGVNHFTYKPRGKYSKNISPALPTTTPGSLIYIDPLNPGKLTATKPSQYAVPVYIRLGSDSEGILLLGGAGGSIGPLGYYASSYILADITARDALVYDDLNLGDFAFVNDIGDASWGFYTVTAKTDPSTITWQLVSSQNSSGGTASGDKIISDDDANYVETQKTGYETSVVIGANNQLIAEFSGNALSTLGEQFELILDNQEVHITSKSIAGTEDIDIRLIPQAGGFVYLGSTGNGIVQPEPTFNLELKGGESDSTSSPGSVLITGGIATSGNFNGGNVILKPGDGFGTGTSGITKITDVYDTSIMEFISAGSASSNYLQIYNGASNSDPTINGVKISVAAGSAASDVDIYLDPKNSGLIKVSDLSAYSAALNNAGNNDALVTKAYVASITGGDSDVILAGNGLTDDAGTFNINVGANTIGIDGSNNLILKSSSTAGQVLVSTGTNTQEATWGSINLSSTANFSGTLGAAYGGTGITIYTEGDLLIGNASGTISKFALGTSGSFLKSNGTTLEYSFISDLNDESGNLAIDTIAAADAVNYFTFTNSASGDTLVISSAGTDTDIDITVSPKNNGLLLAKTGYTDNIGTNIETFVTKGYVDTIVAAGVESYTRILSVSSGWSSELNVGAVLPDPDGKSVYVSQIKMNVNSVIVGGGAVQAKVIAGSNVLMDFNENDILETGTFIVDLPEITVFNNSQVKLQFYTVDGTTAATPTSGNIDLLVFYKFR
jgi:hypothetical protein